MLTCERNASACGFCFWMQITHYKLEKTLLYEHWYWERNEVLQCMYACDMKFIIYEWWATCTSTIKWSSMVSQSSHCWLLILLIGRKYWYFENPDALLNLHWKTFKGTSIVLICSIKFCSYEWLKTIAIFTTFRDSSVWRNLSWPLFSCSCCWPLQQQY